MTTVRILVCDGAKARTFETTHDEPAWRALGVVTHDESREKSSELVTDHAGSRSSEGASVHHNALAAGPPPKEIEKERFARSLAEGLENDFLKHRFDKWVLVAPPHFVGVMRKAISSTVAKHLLTTVEKDFNDLDMATLAERLHAAVRVPPDEVAAIREADKHRH